MLVCNRMLGLRIFIWVVFNWCVEGKLYPFADFCFQATRLAIDLVGLSVCLRETKDFFVFCLLLLPMHLFALWANDGVKEEQGMRGKGGRWEERNFLILFSFKYFSFLLETLLPLC